MTPATEAGDDVFELLDARAAREHAGLEDVEHGVDLGLRDVGLAERDVNQNVNRSPSVR